MLDYLANFFSRHGQENYIRWIPKRKKDEHLNFIGDQIFYDPFKGQSRFTLNVKNDRYQLLHMTGQVHDDRIEVGGIGPARQEYFKNQNSHVPKASSWSLDEFWEPEEDGGLLSQQTDSSPIRLLLVTQISGSYRNRFKLSVCLPDGRFDSNEGIISIVEKKTLIDEEIRDIIANFREAKNRADKTQDPNKGVNQSEYDFEISLNNENINDQKDEASS